MIKSFEEWFERRKLNEATNQCPHCGNVFTTPDWLDTKLHCPKCRQPIEKEEPPPHPTNRDWTSGEKNHYLGRGNW